MRTSVKVLVGVTIAALVACCGGAVAMGVYLFPQRIDTTGAVDFVNPLAIPPLAESTVDGEGRRVFTLTTDEARHDFGTATVATMGYNGSYLGPTLRATRGERVVVNVRNELERPTTLHWHGMELPARMGGGPHQPIEPGAQWSPGWTVDQPAATLWYHPHPHGESATQIYRGLAGMFIVDDPATDAPSLPRDYGVDDIPVVVQDRSFDVETLDDQNSLLSGLGILGDTIAVNGTVAPYLGVTTETVRLRLLNGSNSRVFDMTFVDGRQFALIGTDGGLLAAPHRTDRIMLSPGERAEIVVTVRAGERTVLRSVPTDTSFGGRLTGLADRFDILELRAGGSLSAAAPIPDRLVDLPLIDRAKAGATRDFRLADNTINNATMDMSRVDATVAPGSVEIWRPVNWDGLVHNFHIHGVRFQVLAVDGSPPPPHLRGWKDSVLLPSDASLELIVPFGRHSDPNVPYMFHCHVLYHEDSGMMGQFIVAENGQRGTIGGHAGHG